MWAHTRCLDSLLVNLSKEKFMSSVSFHVHEPALVQSSLFFHPGHWGTGYAKGTTIVSRVALTTALTAISLLILIWVWINSFTLTCGIHYLCSKWWMSEWFQQNISEYDWMCKYSNALLMSFNLPHEFITVVRWNWSWWNLILQTANKTDSFKMTLLMAALVWCFPILLFLFCLVVLCLVFFFFF